MWYKLKFKHLNPQLPQNLSSSPLLQWAKLGVVTLVKDYDFS